MDSPTVKNCELKFKNTREKITLELSFQKLNEKVDIRDFFCDALKQAASLRVELSKGEYIVTDANQTTEEKNYGIMKRLPEILKLFQNFCRIPVKAFDGQTSNSESEVDGSNLRSETAAGHVEEKGKTQKKKKDKDPENKSASEKISEVDNAGCKETNAETDRSKASEFHPRSENLDAEKDKYRDDQQSKSSEHSLGLDHLNALKPKENEGKKDYANSGLNLTTDEAEKHKDKLQSSGQDDKSKSQESHGHIKQPNSNYFSDASMVTSSRDSTGSPASGRAPPKTLDSPELTGRNDSAPDANKTPGSEHSTFNHVPSAPTISSDQEHLKSTGQDSSNNRTSSRGSSPAPSHAPTKNVEPQSTDKNDSGSDVKKTPGSEQSSTPVHATSATTASGAQKDSKNVGSGSAVKDENKVKRSLKSETTDHSENTLAGIDAGKSEDNEHLRTQYPSKQLDCKCEKSETGKCSRSYNDPKPDGPSDGDQKALAGIDAGKSKVDEHLRTQNPSKEVNPKFEKCDTSKYHGEYRNPKPECGSDDD